MQRSIERRHHALLDLGAAESLRRGGELFEIKREDILLPYAKVDGEDLLSFFCDRKVHEEDLIEAPLAQQLRRQAHQVIGSADDEHTLLLLLEPCEERAEHALREAAVSVIRSTLC